VRSGRRALLWLALAAPLAGCEKLFSSKRPFNGIDVTGSNMGGELRLADHDGKARSLGQFRGKAVVVVFGFTHCPDVCPTALSDLSSAVKALGPDGERVQVLFVTVDPKRDLPELMRQFVPAFHPSFLGLTGDEEALAKVRKDFNVYAAIREGSSPDNYSVDHSAQMFGFDPQGQIRLVWSPGTLPKQIADDLRILLNS
jgi:protein SCO1/2